jgi:hypothetical protein
MVSFTLTTPVAKHLQLLLEEHANGIFLKQRSYFCALDPVFTIEKPANVRVLPLLQIIWWEHTIQLLQKLLWIINANPKYYFCVILSHFEAVWDSLHQIEYDSKWHKMTQNDAIWLKVSENIQHKPTPHDTWSPYFKNNLCLLPSAAVMTRYNEMDQTIIYGVVSRLFLLSAFCPWCLYAMHKFFLNRIYMTQLNHFESFRINSSHWFPTQNDSKWCKMT